MPSFFVGDGDELEPEAETPPAPAVRPSITIPLRPPDFKSEPYRSTDRSDLLRLMVRIEELEKKLAEAPSNGKVSQYQFQLIRDEIWMLTSTARRVKERIDAS